MTIWKKGLPEPQALNTFKTATLVEHLGIEVIEATENSLTARMPVDGRTVQPHGRLHGGASVALAETVGSIAANLTLNSGDQVGVGLEINANHVRPVMDGYVYATATPEALGRTTQIWSIRITDEHKRLVCISRFTVAVIPARQA
ncbi:MAG TPA: esterase [Hyphomonas sp.]|jgi:1,4-dihydroxy-2-naphthoyl-CoA hydrolase|uniref:hotdog fold thioesterase n=1 Tax=unclassified Hyphomonas TaxID=2630699 RepID=UPI000C995715|nr:MULTISPECIES: hotdog fold thioesterase [unclassified Hyphomonas]MAO19580.1 esterase [Phycisphaerae bacterium]MBO6582182.1 hotdog fold thioesterase [Hyphomonas sp.]QSR22952.1 esterase [Hyphomonas sp. KY3]HBU34301.1 esterase [Hyphomonas sp.]|tara:strand:+ start:7394 stop:7828 length:435 start_codon:yes stop_codon:yes gene_type:complete